VGSDDPADQVGPDAVDRRSRLLAIKLAALVTAHRGERIDDPPEPFPSGAALQHDGAAWVLIEGRLHDALGRALAWAVGHHAESLDLIAGGDADDQADDDAGALARRARHFELPIRVWRPVGRTLQRVAPTPLLPPPPAPPAHLELRPLIAAGGADPIVEHGVVAGEVRGLEVCRVVGEPTTGSFVGEPTTGLFDDGDALRREGVHLEVGVGAADREAFQLLHGDVPTIEALADVVERVRAHRSPSAAQHPLNRLARERYLRWQAVDDPRSIGLRSLEPAQPPMPRRNLKDPVPCVASGRDADDRPVTAVFSSGVDLDLLPYVADVAATTDDRLLVVLPRRDLLPLTRRVASLLTVPVDFATLG